MAEFIVAIELGSSKIAGIAGKKNMDGSISVLAVVKEEAASCIRKGVVYNIDKTALCLVNIVKKLKTSLKTDISQVYVGIGGQSIRSVKNVIGRDLASNSEVTQEMINSLMDANRAKEYPEQEMLDAVPQEYRVDNQNQVDPVGIQCLHLEGCFLNILWRSTFYRNINKCFEKAGISIADFYLAPFVLADSVLTEGERRSGCVLVDLGAETTTVSVYFRNILRHLAVIPLGSNNITKDIESLQMDERDAEQMKLKYASAYTSNEDIDDKLFYPIDAGRQVESRQFIEIVEGRIEEIIANVWNQVPHEYAEKLLGGIILTGGGSNMPNMEKAFRNFTRIQKVRTAKFVTLNINANQPEIKAHDGTMNTLLGLLAKGKMDCAGRELTDDIFVDGDSKSGLTTDKIITDDNTPMTGGGKVETPAQKKRREEEEEAARKKKEEEDARIAALAEAARKKAEKEASLWYKIKHGLVHFGQKIVEPEKNEDDL